VILYICLLDKLRFRIKYMSEEIKKDNYSADSIQALEGMEHVRMRPSMYIGDVGVRGLHHLVYEVVDNSIDEAGGHCDTIRVDINEDGSISVEDNGWYSGWYS
jgi:DNA gyrase subunit B